MTVTVEKIAKIARQNRQDLDSYLNCNPINPTIQEALEKHGISVRKIAGTISTGRSHIGGEEHMYLVVPKEEVEDVPSDVIVDGALDQFCDERYNDTVFTTLGPREDIPCPAVLTSNDDLYDCFYEEEGW
jgi:hypothetical protein